MALMALMRSKVQRFRLWVVVAAAAIVMLSLQNGVLGDPQVPCYFIFGDSLVDNGNNNNINSLAKANYLPYGIDYPGGPSGRFSNGKTTVDVVLIGYTIALAYCLHKGLPFSAYGELFFLKLVALNTSKCAPVLAIILVAVIYYFSQPVGTKTWIRALVYCAVAPTLLAGQIDPILFEALYASQHAIFFFARVPQIVDNFKNGSTGELSFLTSLMNFGGSLVKVFTSLQEMAPMSVVLGSAIGVATNGAILSQILIYWNAQPKKDKKTD